MLSRAATRFAQEHGFGAVLLAVPVRWDVYSVLVTAISPAIAVMVTVLSILSWRADMWPVLVFVPLFFAGGLLAALVFRGRGLVVCERGILVGSFAVGKDVAAARWDQIELDSLQSYANVKRAFLFKGYRSQRAPQIGTDGRSPGIAFVGPALAAARPQGLTWWNKLTMRGALSEDLLNRLDGPEPKEVWAAAMRQADFEPLAHAVRTALEADGVERAELVAQQLVTPRELPRSLPDAMRAVYQTAMQDGLLGGEPLTDESLQSLIMYQAIAMRPDKARK